MVVSDQQYIIIDEDWIANRERVAGIGWRTCPSGLDSNH